MKRILITGGAGMLAQALKKSFSGDTVLALSRKEMDITDQQQIRQIAGAFKPDIVLNPAAFTGVDDNEVFAHKAFLVNARGAGNMAAAARWAGASIVHFSTDYIFDGCRSVPYSEGDQPNPLSVYGASKLAGEKLVRKMCTEHYIIRTSWLFGRNGQNFVGIIRKRLRAGDSVSAAVDQLGCPTFTEDLAEAVKLMLAGKAAYGTYHLTNSGFCSRYQLAAEIARQTGCSEKLIVPIKMAQLDLKARRPLYTVLDNACWRDNKFPPLRHYGRALADFLQLPESPYQ